MSLFDLRFPTAGPAVRFAGHVNTTFRHRLVSTCRSDKRLPLSLTGSESVLTGDGRRQQPDKDPSGRYGQPSSWLGLVHGRTYLHTYGGIPWHTDPGLRRPRGRIAHSRRWKHIRCGRKDIERLRISSRVVRKVCQGMMFTKEARAHSRLPVSTLTLNLSSYVRKYLHRLFTFHISIVLLHAVRIRSG